MKNHNTLIIVAHPDLEHSVTNKAWMETFTGHVTTYSFCDAYSTGTPTDVAHERALVECHDRVILQSPLYRYSVPMTLEQWTDEAFGKGWAFGEGSDAWVGRQPGVAASCGSAEINFCEDGSQRHTLATFLTPYEGPAAFARAGYIGHHAFYDTYSDTVVERLPANCEAYLCFVLQQTFNLDISRS